jgi:UDP-glucuronate decarboxylase
MSRVIFLTGGTGFFGRSFLNHFVSSSTSDDHIFILSRDPERFLRLYPDHKSHRQLSFIKGDIQDPLSLSFKIPFTHVLHAATDSTFGPQLTPIQRFSQIVEGTRNVLDLAISSGAKRFLLTSSGGIYGSQPKDLNSFAEDWLGSPPLSDPNTAYSQGKRTAEHLCALYSQAYGLQTVIARCFAFIGPDLPLDVHFAIGNFIRDALTAEAITVSGDGTQLRTYLDQSDLAHWLWTLLLEGIAGETYNVGSDEVISIAELAALVRDLIAPNKPVRILGNPVVTAERNRYIPNIAKAQQLHGLTVRIPLAEAIRRTARAHGSQQGHVNLC